MKAPRLLLQAGAVALLCAGCSTWNHMDRPEKATAAGATGGALVGAAVGGPVGAAVGAGVGGYAGHHEAQPGGLVSNIGQGNANAAPSATTNHTRSDMMGDPSLVRSVQQALNDRGYNAGQADGQWGPSTENALRRFQQANGLAQSGTLDQKTMSALGVSR